MGRPGPVAPLPRLLTLALDDHGAGRDAAHALEHGAGADQARQCEDLVEADRVDGALDGGVFEDRLDLRAEDQQVAGVRVEERGHAEVVPGAEEEALATVVQDHGELPVEAGDEVGAVLLVQVRYDFGVAGTLEHVPLGDEFGAQLALVVDLAGGHRDDAAVLAVHRLLSAVEVVDGQPREPEGDTGLHVPAEGVRAAMPDRPVHGPEPFFEKGGGVSSADESEKAAHRRTSPPGISRN